MKRINVVIYVLILVFGTSGIALSGSHLTPPSKRDPEGSIHMAYECDTFTPGKPNVHLAGVDLAGPGDTYRYTVILNDKYANDPNYEVIKATVGIHIDDYDWSKESGDKAPEWGRILINGKPMTYQAGRPWDKRKPGSSEFMEIVSDAEVSRNPEKKLSPPYIFSITDQFKKNKQIVFEITNLREDGSVDGDAAFGNFVVNRIGCHVYYKKK